LRDLVLKHPEYKQDSIISPKIAYDVMTTVSNLEIECPEKLKTREDLLR